MKGVYMKRQEVSILENKTRTGVGSVRVDVCPLRRKSK